MKFYIKHETRGRLRIHLAQKRMSYEQADTLLYYLENLDGVASAKVYERTCDAVVNYQGSREDVICGIRAFHYQDVEAPQQVLQSSGRALNAEYQEKLISKVIYHFGRKLFLPYPLNAIYTTATSSPQDRSTGSGCHCDWCIRTASGFRYCRFHYVPAWNRRNSGRVDT